MQKKQQQDIEITELFVAKCGQDWHRTFIGTIVRVTNTDGSRCVIGTVPVGEYMIVSNASDDSILGRKLDDMTVLILDYKLHDIPAKGIEIANTVSYLN